MDIKTFDGEWGFLSNFAPSEVLWEGLVWPTIEHAYQAAKTLSSEERQKVLLSETPGRAKRLGRKVTLREDWEKVRISVMSELVWLKFSKEPFRTKLLNTGTAHIAEGNAWGDVFWGTTLQGEGENHLGKILMETRTRLVGLENNDGRI